MPFVPLLERPSVQRNLRACFGLPKYGTTRFQMSSVSWACRCRARDIATALVDLAGLAGCSSTPESSAPVVPASAVQAARLFLAAYQAGDGRALNALTNPHGEVLNSPGSLGTVTDVHWRRPSLDNTTYADTVRPVAFPRTR